MGGPVNNQVSPSPVAGSPLPDYAIEHFAKLYQKLKPCGVMPVIFAFKEGWIDRGEVKRAVDLWLIDPTTPHDKQSEWETLWRQTHNEDPPWRRGAEEGPRMLVRVRD
uniref:Uncharacterized protein n=1 Tax=uncultured marine virus TaxID=186617 RepID=A0A0F7L5X5_9VIRU|nr:hypothetical protein [uncultured marine virus]